MRKKPELMSPAGSWEALVAAVQNGADAIYMGGTKFNARRQASNFVEEALRKAVEYAHLYGVRIYITLNTLVKEKELEEWKAFLPELESLHVDGVIVQDLGGAGYIVQNHPNLSLHASTQMTIHQLEGVQVLEEIGFERVVAARELTLKELKNISENSDIELETFIHGALCVSYSGQCLMSSMLGGRSGNRGMCAQPCRLAYTLNKHKDPDNQPTYHISMKDLSTLEILDEILDAGVTGLKIEGRMKRAEYVAVVTREYRKALDSVLKTGKYIPEESAKKELEQIFNRGGFTKGYYYGTDHSDLYAREKPNHWGTYLGNVTRVDKGLVWVHLEDELDIGDGIEFWNQNQEGKRNENKGQLVSRLTWKGSQTDKGEKGRLIGISSSIHPSPGTQVYRTSRASQLKKAEESFQNPYGRKIPINAKVFVKMGTVPVLVFQDFQGVEGKAVGNYEVQKAMNRALDEQTIREQLNRLGDTPFEIQSLELELGEDVFLPVSVLNQLRRDAANELIAGRIAYYDKKALSPKGKRQSNGRYYVHIPEESKNPKLNGYVDSLNFDLALIEGLDILSYAPASFQFSLKTLQEQVRTIQRFGIQVRLALPTITRLEDMAYLRSLPDEFWSLFDDCQVGNLGQIKLLQEKGIQESYGSHTLNVTNSMSMDELSRLGLKGVTLSPELTLAEIRDIMNQTSLPWEILVYGRIVLMSLEYCPHANKKNQCNHCRFMGEHVLTDRKGYLFPVRKKRISHCYSELWNSQPIFLADQLAPFYNLGASSWGLNLEGMPPADWKPVIQSYRFGLEHPGKNLPEDLGVYTRKVKDSGFTKGHFFRGVE